MYELVEAIFVLGSNYKMEHANSVYIKQYST